ncbi:Two-component response regulator ARR2-like [Heracleum sosnowskyi]|uniref:Two-component response regulator ARR2-like n=1 Tax=Heracleum sosnowskyi TaxID=360622 RepID=A0AAD8MSB0_9APIA|nr:Two-component response regulator ARR2-like [Heracleum sosnowskyi]
MYKSKPGNVQRASCIVVHARRRIRYDEEEGDGNDYGNNEDVAMLEYYSESVKEIALVVKAEVDEQEVEILIFKGFSSSLSHSTSPDPSRSILPARAKIKSIDRIKGPFNPSNIEYIEKGISLEAFRGAMHLITSVVPCNSNLAYCSPADLCSSSVLGKGSFPT